MSLLDLDDLEKKFLDAGTPIHRGNTEIEPIRDGIQHFRLILDAIDRTEGEGDAIYIVGWRFDSTFDFIARRLGLLSGSIGDLLVQKAALGVDVRVILDGHLSFSNFEAFQIEAPGFPPISVPRIAGFRDNAIAVHELRTRSPASAPGTTPLADRVLLDWSNAAPISSHHQKVTVVQMGADVVAFVGGMDYWSTRLDEAPHDKLRYPTDGSRWGWHDAAIQVRGAAVTAIWENFSLRWAEAASLPLTQVTRYWVRPAGSVLPRLEPFIPSPLAPDPKPAPAMPPLSSLQSVQVLRSRFKAKYNLPPYIPWTFPPTGGIYETFQTLKKAILAAQSYIYIEDQFCQDNFIFNINFSLFPSLQSAAAALNNVKVIFVSSAMADPDDPSPGSKNDTLNSYFKRHLVDPLPESKRGNVVLYRVEHLTVHSKLMIVDDRFIAIGSANIQNRSMDGQDMELHVAAVDAGTLIRDFRVRLWAEHLRVELGSPTLQEALANLETAFGIWRPEWLPPGTPSDMWRIQDNPPGFRPAEKVLTLVGPAFH